MQVIPLFFVNFLGKVGPLPPTPVKSKNEIKQNLVSLFGHKNGSKQGFNVTLYLKYDAISLLQNIIGITF